MSHPSRPQARGPARRQSRQFRILGLENLEERQLLAPYVTPTDYAAPAVGTPVITTANGVDTAVVTITVAPATTATFPSAAPVTSVSELTPLASFGGDIVRIKAGPGGVFGNAIYAISRGAGDNRTGTAVNRPGVIYRVDPATGKSSVFFDLNTVLNQLEPGGNASSRARTR